MASRHSSVTAQRPSVLANGVFKATRFKAPTPDSKNEFWENHLEGGHFSGKDKGFFDGERGITLRVAVCFWTKVAVFHDSFVNRLGRPPHAS